MLTVYSIQVYSRNDTYYAYVHVRTVHGTTAHGLATCHVCLSVLRRRSAVKAMSGNIEPATLRRKTFSGRDLELLVRQEQPQCVCTYIHIMHVH